MGDQMDDFERLTALYREGVLTEQEYDEQFSYLLETTRPGSNLAQEEQRRILRNSKIGSFILLAILILFSAINHYSKSQRGRQYPIATENTIVNGKRLGSLKQESEAKARDDQAVSNNISGQNDTAGRENITDQDDIIITYPSTANE